MAEQPRSETTDIAMLVFALAPVSGAILAGPIAGTTLATLSLLDSILIALGII